MNEEYLELISELSKKIDELKAIASEMTPYVVAFKYCLESLNNRLSDLEHESERLNEDLKSGINGYGMTRKCFEVRVKKELIDEILCFMCESIDMAKAGDIE